MRTLLFALLMAAACQQGKSKLDDNTGSNSLRKVTTGSGSGSAAIDTTPAVDIDSKDILARAPVGQEVQV